jgi:3-deoxy-manno-octulosonate cytidylyltransferase (CMP-KDO synthetase)
MKTFNEYHLTGIIPARYASTRFPGKPLVDIVGKTMIQRVYEQASLLLDKVYVATDDDRIHEAVLKFGGRSVFTSPLHQSGTDRCAEAVRILAEDEGIETDVVINIQGDEPFIKPEQIGLLVSCFADKAVEIATLIRKVKPDEDISNPNHPKVVVDISGNALYFSRSIIPYFRDAGKSDWTKLHTYYKHLGLYAYRKDTLNRITSLSRGMLEKAESLEQNRWLENGFKIRTAVTEWESVCIDTPDDLEKAIEYFKEIK